MLWSTEKEIKPHQDSTICYICLKTFTQKLATDENPQDVRDQCRFTAKYRGAAHIICNLRFNLLNEIPIVFHNGSSYDNHFIMKELAVKSNDQFECLGENTEKYKTFSVPIGKEIKKDVKDGNENITAVSYKIDFIDSTRLWQVNDKVCQ